MALPLVLAGPILRRVESNLVSVWIALSRPANVTITVWEGRIKPGAAGEFFRSNPPTPTLRIADNLHVTVALARIPAGSQKAFKPGVIYSYDLTIVAGANTHTLASLGLLKNIPTANGGPAGSERPHLALGYMEDFLPSFALPPDKLEDLRIVYGSCRRPANEHPDAMAMIDDLITADLQKPLYEDALKRPHQLVLGGDQIYADDVWAGHMLMLNPLANELIGTVHRSAIAASGRAHTARNDAGRPQESRCRTSGRSDQSSGRLGAGRSDTHSAAASFRFRRVVANRRSCASRR